MYIQSTDGRKFTVKPNGAGTDIVVFLNNSVFSMSAKHFLYTMTLNKQDVYNFCNLTSFVKDRLLTSLWCYGTQEEIDHILNYSNLKTA